jgi:hypothetical protein
LVLNSEAVTGCGLITDPWAFFALYLQKNNSLMLLDI